MSIIEETPAAVISCRSLESEQTHVLTLAQDGTWSHEGKKISRLQRDGAYHLLTFAEAAPSERVDCSLE